MVTLAGFECQRTLEMHIYVAVAGGMSHHELNKTTLSCSRPFFDKAVADRSMAVAVFVRNKRIDARRCSSSYCEDVLIHSKMTV